MISRDKLYEIAVEAKNKQIETTCAEQLKKMKTSAENGNFGCCFEREEINEEFYNYLQREGFIVRGYHRIEKQWELMTFYSDLTFYSKVTVSWL